MQQVYGDYLKDESNSKGIADRIFFPKDDSDLKDIFEKAKRTGVKVTLSGGRTGITGGCVPKGGWLVSFERMDRFLGLRFDPVSGNYFVRCQSGVLLKDLQDSIAGRQFSGCSGWDEASRAAMDTFQKEERRFFYPPDPTERLSQMGGNAACNASGSRTYKYGPTRNYVSRIRVLLADGTLLDVPRGSIMADAKDKLRLKTFMGNVVLTIPPVKMPQTKNAAGYFMAAKMDMVDLFIGSEGTLGAITEVELRLIPEPKAVGDVAVLLKEEKALDLAKALKSSDLDIASMEYLCSRSLALLRKAGQISWMEQYQGEGSGETSCILLSLESKTGSLDPELERLAKVLSQIGAGDARTLVALDPPSRERFRVLRHGVPEAVNSLIANIKLTHTGITKLGTDLAVPFASIQKMAGLYKRLVSEKGLDYVMFGHLGDGHLHVNIIPKDEAQYKAGKKLYIELAKEAIRLGGSVSGEHGIGKLKRDLLELMYPPKVIEGMQKIKEALDPAWMLNPGNLFPSPE
jgi:D-lactate dehydrogenase (cytochrome)